MDVEPRASGAKLVMVQETALEVLLIEDSRGDARLIEELIAETSPGAWRVDWADSLASGLRRFEQETPDALLLDLGLPDSQGIETLIRAHTHASGVPIVVMSGLDDPLLITRALEEGARDYLVKGTFDGRTLVRCLTRAVELHRAEELRSRLVAIVESSEDAIIATTLDGIVTSWNAGAERLFGDPADEVIGKPVSLLIRPDDHDMPAILEGLRRGERIPPLEIVRVREDRTPIHLSLVVSPICAANGQVTGASAVARDVTENKRAAEKMRRLNEELERRLAEVQATNRELESFTYTISHDLRAPLRAIDGFSRIVCEEHRAILPEDALRHLDVVRESAKRMGRLVDDLLEFSRLGRRAISRQPVRLEQLAREALQEFRAEQGSRHVEVAIGDLPGAQGDPALLKQALANLVGNALKFTRKRDPSVIEIGSRAEDGTTVYFVRDNGAGFDMRYADKLFGVFERLHRAEDYEGTGMGLAIVERIVRRHGGRVWAESAPDRGATFFFTLGEGRDA